MGLHQAFPDAEIVGVDLKPQKRFPFTFVQGDALTFPLDGFDFVWASFPCQDYTVLRARTGKRYARLLDAGRWRLVLSGKPWIMENVPGSTLRKDAVLCGNSFGLRVYRHRWFEASFPISSPEHVKHVLPTGRSRGQTQRKASYMAGNFVTVTGNVGSYAGPAMGINWMTGDELSQAIPPAYSKYLAQFIPTGKEVMPQGSR